MNKFLSTKKSTSTRVSEDSEFKSDGVHVDHYGFYVDDHHHQSLEVSERTILTRKEKEKERTKKWIKMLKNWDFTETYRKEKLKRRVRKGICDNVRGLAWTKLSQAWRYRKQCPDLDSLNMSDLPDAARDDVSYIGAFSSTFWDKFYL